MFNFKKVIIYSLSMIIPYIICQNSIEASIYDYTTSNNRYEFPVIITWSKAQLNCGTCAYFTTSRLMEYIATRLSIETSNKKNNYDVSVDWLIDIYKTSKNQNIFNCDTDCGLSEDTWTELINAVKNNCETKYTVNYCIMESKWCPYSYGGQDTDVNVNKICTQYHTNNIVKFVSNGGDININTQIYNNDIARTKLLGLTLSGSNVYYSSIYLTTDCLGHINSMYKNEPNTLITNNNLYCKLPSGITPYQSNHGVTIVGIGLWPYSKASDFEEGTPKDYTDVKYAKILNSYGNKSGDNGFLYVYLDTITTDRNGPLNIYSSIREITEIIF